MSAESACNLHHTSLFRSELCEVDKSLTHFISDCAMPDTSFDLTKVTLRPPLPAIDYAWSIREDELLGWHTAQSHIKLVMNPDVTDGYIIAEYDGKPVGSLLAYKFTDTDVFVGLYLVSERYRGLGVGKKLWNWLLNYSKGRDLWLCSPEENLDAYARKGMFPIQDVMQFRQFSHVNKKQENFERIKTESEMELQEITDDNLHLITAYDREVCECERGTFWKHWMSVEVKPGCVAMTNGNVRGFVFIVASDSIDNHHYRIAPLFADNGDIALSLFEKITENLPTDSQFFADYNTESHCTETLRPFLEEKAFSMSSYTLSVNYH